MLRSTGQAMVLLTAGNGLIESPSRPLGPLKSTRGGNENAPKMRCFSYFFSDNIFLFTFFHICSNMFQLVDSVSVDNHLMCKTHVPMVRMFLYVDLVSASAGISMS